MENRSKGNIKKPKQSKNINVGGVALPVSFADFVKNPVAAVAFMAILGISYLYIDQKSSYNKLIEDQGAKIANLDARIINLTDQVRRSDSLLSAATSKIMVLEQLGKIPKE